MRYLVDFVKFLTAWRISTSSHVDKTQKRLNLIKQLNGSIGGVRHAGIPLTLVLRDERVFNYFQTVNILHQNGFYKNANTMFFEKLIALNTKCGFKLKAFSTYGVALNFVHNYFNTFNEDINKEYPTYSVFFEFSRTFSEEFYKPDFFIKYIHLYLEFIFLVKKVKPKKKSKKRKQPSKMLISYIPTRSRSGITLRVINAYINGLDNRSKTARIAHSLLYLALSGKTSFLYIKKLTMYNKLLEKKKFY